MGKYIITPWMDGILSLVKANIGFRPTRILLEGPPGASKTSFAEYLAKEVIAQFFEFNFRSSMKAEDLLYEIAVLPGNQISYVPSPLWEAFNASHEGLVVLVLDEVDKAKERAEELLLRTLETFGFRDPFGKRVEGRPENLIVIATSNGKRDLMEPTLRRFPVRIQVGFPDIATQAEIIHSVIGDSAKVTESAIYVVIKIAEVLRRFDANKAPSYAELAELLISAQSMFKKGFPNETVREVLEGTLWKNGELPQLPFNWVKALRTELNV